MKKLPLLLILAFVAAVCFGQTDKMPVFKSPLSPESQPEAAKSMECWERGVQYIGPYKGIIPLKRAADLYKVVGNSNYLSSPRLYFQYSRYDNVKLKIRFDTSKQVTLEKFKPGGGYNYIKAYPILICNETDSSILVGFGYNIPIILEALDVDDNWKPVEEEYTYRCTDGYHHILLNAREVLCVLVPVYTGEFKTKLRYRFGESYSNEFYGSISPGQFTWRSRY